MPVWRGLVVTLYVLIAVINPHFLRNEGRRSTGHSGMFLLTTSMCMCSTEHIVPR